MANEFSVTPLGGLDVGAKLDNVLEGARSRKRSMDWQKKAPEVIKSGNPDAIADLMIEFPEMQQQVAAAAGYKRQQSIQDMVDTAAGILSGTADPAQLLGQHIQKAQSAGEDVSKPMNTLGKTLENPEHSKQWAEKILALYSPEQYKSFISATAGPEGIKPTANIQDYQYYMKLKESNPTEASLFARQIGLLRSTDPDIKPTSAQQNFKQWTMMPEGPNKEAFARMLGIDPKKSPEEEQKRLAKIDEISDQIYSTADTLALVEVIRNNKDYLNALTGVRGSIPFSVPGGAGWDAETALNQLISSLTLENMGKMKGVLSDADIKMIKEASAGLKQGLSKPVMKKKLDIIYNTLSRKLIRAQEKIEGMGYTEEMSSSNNGQQSVKGAPGVYELNTDEDVFPKPLTTEPNQTSDYSQYDASGLAEGTTATGPNGEKIIVRNGKFEAM